MTAQTLLFDCQKYAELDGPEDVRLQQLVGENTSDSFVQLKYDGIWARIVVENNEVKVYSKTHNLKHSFPVDKSLSFATRQPIVLVGEFMFGSQWAQRVDRAGKLFCFDCLVSSGEDISGLPYKDRYRQMVSHVIELGDPFNLLPCYALTKWGGLWMELTSKESFEGLIFRKWSQPYNSTLWKLKREVEDDFVILRLNPGEGKHAGRMGSVTVGQYDNGILVEVGEVGGGFSDATRTNWWHNPEMVLAKVMLARGKGRFESGALRHPNFIRIRDDKSPTQCILKRTSKSPTE